MTLSDAIRTCLRKYATFSGRAPRSEYWWFALFYAAGYVLTGWAALRLAGEAIDPVRLLTPFTGPVQSTFVALFVLPLIAVKWRRMHDISRPGWHAIYPLVIGLIGYLILSIGGWIIDLMIWSGFGTGLLKAHGPLVLRSFELFADAFLAFAAVMQAVVAWWLSRPTAPGPNWFGVEPDSASTIEEATA